MAKSTCEVCGEPDYEPICPSCHSRFEESFATLVHFIGVQECRDAVNRNFDPDYGYRQGKTMRAEAADALMDMLVSEYSLYVATHWMTERKWY